jgi:hypothetical protein
MATTPVEGDFSLVYLVFNTIDNLLTPGRPGGVLPQCRRPPSPHLGRSPHRYIWPSELDLMGRLAGFELESRSADWQGNPFTEASTSHVSVYRLQG